MVQENDVLRSFDFAHNTKRSTGRNSFDVDCQKPHIVQNSGGCLGLGNSNSNQIEVDDLTFGLEYSNHFRMTEILQRKRTRK